MTLPSSHADVIILGAGASGLICAAEAGRRGRSVIILEHNDRIGRKVLVSGGGRCNFTNINAGAEHYLSQNPHFCKSALAGFSPGDFIARLRAHQISYDEKEEGQLFCSGSSSQVVRMLQEDCAAAGVRILLGQRVHDVRRDGRFIVRTGRGTFSSDSLVVATGGLSYPSLGATDIGFRIARSFGLAVTHLSPSLVPLVFSTGDAQAFSALSGLSFNAEVSCGKARFRGPVLFTHRGLSGPAVLQISSYWDKGSEIRIDLLPGTDAPDLLREKRDSRMELQTFLARFLPRRFTSVWCARYAPSRPLCEFSPAELQEVGRRLHGWIVRPSATGGFAKAEVTRGGVDTAGISSKTLEAKDVSGLFFIGEVLDVTGQLGGYNLHWAWASGYAAGQHV